MSQKAPMGRITKRSRERRALHEKVHEEVAVYKTKPIFPTPSIKGTPKAGHFPSPPD
jgi:hypothetical protein